MNKKELIINCGLYKDDKLILRKLRTHVVISITYDDGTTKECIINSMELNKLKNYINNLELGY